jgi:xanthine dehydrogenase accessory factor
MSGSFQRWQQAVADLHGAGRGFVLVTLLRVRGSAPRGPDSKMVITDSRTFDTIGGGRLEHEAIAIARRLIQQGLETRCVEEFNLGPKLDQCCGGQVEILFEYFPGTDLHIELHGAGHVGRALTRILAQIDCRLRWIDERAAIFQEDDDDLRASNVRTIIPASAAAEVGNAPAGAWYLVMTHSHPLDLEIVDAVLSRGDASYLGLIGSRSKAASFRKRLAERGFGEQELARLECPMGIPGVGGKEPMQIAVAVAADILRRHRAAADARQAQSSMMSAER